MAEVILDEPQIVAFVGEGKSTGMTEHVRMYRCQPRPRSGSGDKVVHGLPGEWLAAFGKEQPGQRVLTARGLKARSSSPAIGCSTDSPPLRRRTHKRARSRSTSSRRIVTTSLTRRPWRNITSSSKWSRAPCRPVLAASNSNTISPSLRKSLARSCPSAASFGRGAMALFTFHLLGGRAGIIGNPFWS
jgi:hypothetical protein